MNELQHEYRKRAVRNIGCSKLARTLTSQGTMKSIIFYFLLCTSQILAELTILKTTQTIYDKSPKLRIRGSGFEVDDHDIILDLAPNGQNNLVVDKDFMVSKDSDGDGLILKLLGNRRYSFPDNNQ